MQLHCISTQLVFECFDGHKVVAGFDGGVITSDAGALLLRHVDKVIGLFERMAACFVDAALRLARSTVRTRWSGSASRRSPWDSSTSTTMTGCAITRFFGFCRRA